jgi:pimeloyl-ACP methyl ester carboxylesterase
VHHIYLIPGFFGFSNLGNVLYFRAVRETLAQSFAERGEPLEIFGVRTFPTGSLARRARRVLEEIDKNDSLRRADAIHLIGHSTGGIDARLVASTAEGLGLSSIRPKLADRLKTVVCLSAPHYGTPLANFFTTIYGKKLLYFITLLVFVGLWRRPIAFAGGVLGLGYKAYNLLGLNETLLLQLTNQLLREFTPERQAEVRSFLDSILKDVALMIQLTPESMEVLNATIRPLEGVRHVSYATISPPPIKIIDRARWREWLDPLSVALYSALYSLAAKPESGYSYHPPIEPLAFDTGGRLPLELDPTSNDGVVPSLSQIYGEFRGFVKADHLDVVGHYLRGPLEKQDGADWFLSGAKFSLDAFERLWGDVTRVLLREA